MFCSGFRLDTKDRRIRQILAISPCGSRSHHFKVHAKSVRVDSVIPNLEEAWRYRELEDEPPSNGIQQIVAASASQGGPWAAPRRRSFRISHSHESERAVHAEEWQMGGPSHGCSHGALEVWLED